MPNNIKYQYQELRRKEGKLMDNVETDFTDLQLQIATQNNKKKSGKRRKQREIVGAMMSNRIAPIIKNTNYSYNYSYNKPRHLYTEYKQDTYVYNHGNWEFNPRSSPRNVIVNQYNVQPLHRIKPIPPVVPPVGIVDRAKL